jgi:RimJ/RimL family protein N-acetyltransferase
MMEALDAEQARLFLSLQSQLSEDASGWRMFSVEQLTHPGLIGEVGLFISEDDPAQANLGWWLHPDYRGEGYAVEGAKALIEWCFSGRGLHRLTATCLAANLASRKVMGKIGMRLESVSVESRMLAGQWHNEVGYALLRREWAVARDEHPQRHS